MLTNFIDDFKGMLKELTLRERIIFSLSVIFSVGIVAHVEYSKHRFSWLSPVEQLVEAIEYIDNDVRNYYAADAETLNNLNVIDLFDGQPIPAPLSFSQDFVILHNLGGAIQSRFEISGAGGLQYELKLVAVNPAHCIDVISGVAATDIFKAARVGLKIIQTPAEIYSACNSEQAIDIAFLSKGI